MKIVFLARTRTHAHLYVFYSLFFRKLYTTTYILLNNNTLRVYSWPLKLYTNCSQTLPPLTTLHHPHHPHHPHRKAVPVHGLCKSFASYLGRKYFGTAVLYRNFPPSTGSTGYSYTSAEEKSWNSWCIVSSLNPSPADR